MSKSERRSFLNSAMCFKCVPSFLRQFWECHWGSLTIHLAKNSEQEWSANFFSPGKIIEKSTFYSSYNTTPADRNRSILLRFIPPDISRHGLKTEVQLGELGTCKGNIFPHTHNKNWHGHRRTRLSIPISAPKLNWCQYLYRYIGIYMLTIIFIKKYLYIS